MPLSRSISSAEREIEAIIANSNWACIVSAIQERLRIATKSLANAYLQNQYVSLPALSSVAPVTVAVPVQSGQDQLPRIAG